MRKRYKIMWWFIGITVIFEEIHNFSLNPNPTLLAVFLDIAGYIISWIIVFVIIFFIYDLAMKLFGKNKKERK